MKRTLPILLAVIGLTLGASTLLLSGEMAGAQSDEDSHVYHLEHQWNLITWQGEDAIAVEEALSEGEVSDKVAVIYSWDSQSGSWDGYFPDTQMSGANDLESLFYGHAYWIAISEMDGVEWEITRGTSSVEITPTSTPDADETSSPGEPPNTEEPVDTSTPTNTPGPGTPTAVSTNTPKPTNTPESTATSDPDPTSVTDTPEPTSTNTPVPTSTNTPTPEPTNTPTPEPTNTPTPEPTNTPTPDPELECIGSSTYSAGTVNSPPNMETIYVSHRRPCQGDSVTVRVTIDSSTPADAMHFKFAIGGEDEGDKGAECTEKHAMVNTSGNVWEATVSYTYTTRDGFGYRIAASNESGNVSYTDLSTAPGTYFAFCDYPAELP